MHDYADKNGVGLKKGAGLRKGAGPNTFEPSHDFVLDRIRVDKGCMNLLTVVI